MLSVVVVAVLSALRGFAEGNSGNDSVPAERWRGAVGELEAIVLFTDQPEAFLKEWSQPSASTPQISSVDVAHRGDTLVAFVFFSGCKPRKGSCNADVDFRLQKPDGSLYAEEIGMELWRDKSPPPVGYFQISVANLGLTIEREDPVGGYMLKAVIHDRIAERDLVLERELEVLAR